MKRDSGIFGKGILGQRGNDEVDGLIREREHGMYGKLKVIQDCYSKWYMR